MVKVSGKGKTGRDFYLFGLSARNVELLKQGKPIRIALEPLGGTGDVLLMYGENEAAIADELERSGFGRPEAE